MDDELEKDAPKIQADHQSIAIGEINISGTVTGNITIGHTIVQPADARLRHELGVLLKNVQTTWIKGVLEKSVHEAALFELGLELREEAVDNPWRMVIEGPDQTQQTLPRGRKIKDIFDEANRLLLILGEPGSGKTTTLLQLARDLIAEVDEAFTQPVPVVLNLSTWTNKAQPLDEWMITELNGKYRLPKKDGQRWLKERRILPLLDGLDEVRAENRADCVARINQLVVDYSLQGMVVCSRIKDYTDLSVRLAFYRAIYIQPLSPEQVDEYLNRAGDKLASLRATLQADEALRSMAQSPLILNIMSLAYQNASAEDLSNPKLATNETRRHHLFDTYIARMFSRKTGKRPYDDEQTKQRLSWLARNMQKHNQEVFLVEGLQPSWLIGRLWKWIYIVVSRLISGLILGSTYYGLIGGLCISFIDALRFEGLPHWRGLRKNSRFWWSVINAAVVGMIVGLLIRLLDRSEEGLTYGLVYGLLFGLIFGLRGSRQNPENDIQTVEELHWSWRKALKGGLLFGLIFGLLAGLYGLISGLREGLLSGLISLLGFGLIFGPLAALVGIVFMGLSREIRESKSIVNQGIWLSIRSAIFAGLLVGLIYGLVGGLSSGGRTWLRDSMNFGVMGALWFGGVDVIQHYTLRLSLLIQGYTPANYARFLDYAVDRIFLQKVGGGYRFIHRLLLEHFAEMGETKRV